MNLLRHIKIPTRPLQFGALLWLLCTLLKIAISSVILATGNSMGHTALFIVTITVQVAVLVYLVTDLKAQRLRRYAFFLGMTALTDFATVLYFWRGGHYSIGPFHFLMVGIAYTAFNQYTVRSLGVRLTTYAYLIFSLAWLFNRETPIIAAWFAMMSAALIALDMHRSHKITREMEIDDIRKDFEVLRRKYRLANARAKTIRHDMQSVLLPLEMVCAEHKANACGTSCKAIIESVRKNIADMVSHLDSDERTEFNVRGAVANVMNDLGAAVQYVNMDALLDFTVTFNRDIFDSIIFNLVMNAREAYERRNGTLVGMAIGIAGEPNRIIIRDNAGGFDYEKIAAGRSEKTDATPENGMFLHNVVDNAAAYEVSLTFSPVQYGGGKGTKVAVELL